VTITRFSLSEGTAVAAESDNVVWAKAISGKKLLCYRSSENKLEIQD